MEIRPLVSTDIFPLCQIIKKIGIDEIKQCFSNIDIQSLIPQNDNDQDENKTLSSAVKGLYVSVAFDLASIIIGNLPKCKEDIYSFLADLTSSDQKELEALKIADFAQLIIDLLQKEDLKDFIGVVSKLFE